MDAPTPTPTLIVVCASRDALTWHVEWVDTDGNAEVYSRHHGPTPARAEAKARAFARGSAIDHSIRYDEDADSR